MIHWCVINLHFYSANSQTGRQRVAIRRSSGGLLQRRMGNSLWRQLRRRRRSSRLQESRRGVTKYYALYRNIVLGICCTRYFLFIFYFQLTMPAVFTIKMLILYFITIKSVIFVVCQTSLIWDCRYWLSSCGNNLYDNVSHVVELEVRMFVTLLMYVLAKSSAFYIVTGVPPTFRYISIYNICLIVASVYNK